MGDVTELIARAREGDRAAFDRLFELLYPELRRIAHARLSRNVRDALIDTTALVHECYLKFSQGSRLTPADRVHFLSYAATVMRSIVVDAARAALSQRRGGGDVEHVTLSTDVAEAAAAPENEILDVHAALEEINKLDPRLVRVVEMRYFGGMRDEDIAQALGLTDRTVRRDWEKARLLLSKALRGG